MREIEIGGTVHKIDCTAFTPFIYAEEFTVERNGRRVPEDINSAIAEIWSANEESGIPPMLKMLQLFWAFEKTANEKTPHFKNWLRKLPSAALALNDEHGWATDVTEVVQENFFPKATQEVLASAT